MEHGTNLQIAIEQRLGRRQTAVPPADFLDSMRMHACVLVCVCVCNTETARERGTEGGETTRGTETEK